ncbi:MFS transporter [Natronomonas marina]|jgi:MFS family permease|uniref:MFS transporter n=1 Tax=Natronomonas marina TaxID=2961939 RepID=UPI0020CA16DB|nr:MFS transporter [Natronomonas marina]
MNRNDRRITGFTMVGHGLVHTYELAVPILVTVWLVEFSVTAATLGAAVSVGYALFGAGAIPGGVLADRFGSRRLIAACLLGMGLSFALLSLAPGVGGVVVALGAWGLAASVYHPAGLALISNGVDERGAAFAYHGMAGNVGIAGGPFVVALLLVPFDWRTAVLVLAVPGVVAGVAGLRVDLEEHRTAEIADGGEAPTTEVESLRDFVAASRGLFTAGFLTVLGIVLFNGLYYRGVLTFLPELLGGFLAPLVGGETPAVGPLSAGPAAAELGLSRYLFTGLLVVGVAGQYVGGRLTDAVEPERGLAGMLAVLVAVALLFVPAAGAAWSLVAVSAALGFTLFGLQPLSQATIAAYSPPDRRGLSFGYTYLAIFGVGALGASLAGVVLTYSTPATVFLLFAGFAAAALVLASTLVFGDR